MSSVDLSIPPGQVNPEEALRDWSWLLTRPLRPIFASKFGDWFFFNTQGQVEMLDAIEGTLSMVAENAQEFNALTKTPEKQSRWFLDGLVYRMMNDGFLLLPGECYGFAVAPVLGGTFDVSNIKVFSLRLYNSMCGQLHQQLRSN